MGAMKRYDYRCTRCRLTFEADTAQAATCHRCGGEGKRVFSTVAISIDATPTKTLKEGSSKAKGYVQ